MAANVEKEEDTGGHFEPLVKLDEVQVKTGESEEEELLKMRAKLFIFVTEDVYGGEKRTNFWKERGLGNIKLLKNKAGKIRVLMRQEKTLKIIANHFVAPSHSLAPNVGSDKSWVHRAMDYADPDDPGEQTFAIRFKDAEAANEFKDKFEDAKKANAAAGGAAEGEAKAAEGEASSSGGGAAAADDEKAAIDKALEARNKKESTRRASVQAELALNDPEYDSDEENVDEGAAARVKQQFGDKKDGDQGVLDAAAALDKVQVN